MEVRYDSVRLWHYKTVDGPMDYKLDERTRSPICLHSSYQPPGAGCLEAQQDHNENNEPGFYSLENGPSKRNPRLQAVLDWEAGILVLSVAAYLLPLLVRLQT